MTTHRASIPLPWPEDTEPYLLGALKSWSLLWLFYNALLFVQGMLEWALLVALEKAVDHDCAALDSAPLFIAIYAVAGNLCFCLGPAVEIALYTMARHRLGRGRYVLFALGMLFAMWMVFCPFARGWVHIGGYGR